MDVNLDENEKYQQLIKLYPELALPENKMRLALRLSDLNQKRCQTLLFKIWK